MNSLDGTPNIELDIELAHEKEDHNLLLRMLGRICRSDVAQFEHAHVHVASPGIPQDTK